MQRWSLALARREIRQAAHFPFEPARRDSSQPLRRDLSRLLHRDPLQRERLRPETFVAQREIAQAK
jgi:hypothetical protein